MADFIVTNTSDSGAGSLRQAMADASAASNFTNNITFDPSLAGQVITVTSPLVWDGPFDLNINGDTDGDTGTAGARGVTISGGGTSQVIINNEDLTGSGTLTLQNLTIADGFANTGFPVAAILNQTNANLDLKDVLISNNQSFGVDQPDGPGTDSDRATIVANLGSLDMQGVLFDNLNIVEGGDGSSTFADDGGNGGEASLIFNTGTITGSQVVFGGTVTGGDGGVAQLNGGDAGDSFGIVNFGTVTGLSIDTNNAVYTYIQASGAVGGGNTTNGAEGTVEPKVFNLGAGTFSNISELDDQSGTFGDDALSPNFVSPPGVLGDPTFGFAGNDTFTGTSARDQFFGGTGQDIINGLDDDDVLSGGDDNDTINGGEGDDTINGGDGNDTITDGLPSGPGASSQGADMIFGDGGDDTIIANFVTGGTYDGGSGTDTLDIRGDDTDFSGSNAIDLGAASWTSFGATFSNFENVMGGDGVHEITGSNGANVLSGGGGEDTINGAGGADTLNGEGDNDTLNGGAGTDNDILNGGSGTDTADYSDATSDTTVILFNRNGIAQTTVSSGRDTLIDIENLIGSDFNDKLIGDIDSNAIRGGIGSDNIDGGGGDDMLFGEDGNDGFRPRGANVETFDGGEDTDFVNYSASTGVNAFLDGSGTNGRSAFNDTFVDIENLIGSDIGGDLLYGDAGANRLTGLGGNDTLRGRAGIDQLEGGDGDDTFIGDEGADVYVTGIGSDTIVFNLSPDAANRDRITDFTSGQDTLQIDASVFGGGLVAGATVQLVANGNPTANSAGATFLYDTDNGTLRFDADGNGAGAAELFALLQNVPTLLASDFDVVA